MATNNRKSPQTAFLKEIKDTAQKALMKDASEQTSKTLRIPYKTGIPEDGTNLWIDQDTGMLCWLSPNGVTQAVGFGGQGDTAFADEDDPGPDYVNVSRVLTASASSTTPSNGEGNLWYGGTTESLITFTVDPAIPPTAEILKVELMVSGVSANTSDPQLYVADVLASGYSLGSGPAPVSYGPIPQVGEAWITIARAIGERFRDGVSDSIVLLPNPTSPLSKGLVAGHSTNLRPPVLRITYQTEAATTE